MSDLIGIRQRIDTKITELRQHAYFVLNKYDYHHKNDELEIIAKQMDILNRVSESYTQFLNEMQKFNQTLDGAKEMSGQVEQLLQMQLQQQSTVSDDDGRRQQHEMITPKSCTKDTFKDKNTKKQLFPPA